MELIDCNLVKLLPGFMRSDAANQCLCDFMNKVTWDLADKIKLLSVWNEIDRLSNDNLDALAWELHITWYDPKASIDVKRQIIKDSDLVYSKMGTKWAVERVAKTYFGESKIIEWFEYGGEPFCFKVETINQKIVSSLAAEFLKMLDIVKRESAHLDIIDVTIDGELEAYNFSVASEYEICATYIKI